MESLCVRVHKKEGEAARRNLIELGAIDSNLRIRPEGEDLLIPVVRAVENFSTERGDFEAVTKEKSLIETLGLAPAYEVIGDIAIIDQYESDAQRVADALLQEKKIKAVFQAAGAVAGEYRTRDLIFLAGEKKTETLYKENGCRYLLDVARVYFTPRLATERMRIASQVKNGEVVVDMFSGVGPFSILIAKTYPSSRVIAIDKNPVAIKYLKENVRLNKLKNVEVREGDAGEEVKGISADHVIMNLPHSSFDFLGAAFKAVRKGGVIHFYAITHEDDLFDGVLRKIENEAGKAGWKILPLNKRVVRPYAPYQYHICIDFMVM